MSLIGRDMKQNRGQMNEFFFFSDNRRSVTVHSSLKTALMKDALILRIPVLRAVRMEDGSEDKRKRAVLTWVHLPVVHLSRRRLTGDAVIRHAPDFTRQTWKITSFKPCTRQEERQTLAWIKYYHVFVQQLNSENVKTGLFQLNTGKPPLWVTERPVWGPERISRNRIIFKISIFLDSNCQNHKFLLFF